MKPHIWKLHGEWHVGSVLWMTSVLGNNLRMLNLVPMINGPIAVSRNCIGEAYDWWRIMQEHRF